MGKGIVQFAADLVCFLFYLPVKLLVDAGDAAAAILSTPTGAVKQVMDVIDKAAAAGIPLVQSVAYLIAFMFFLFSMIELCMSERLTVETFIKQFAYFIVGYALVYCSPKLYELIRNFGNDFTSWLSNQLSIGPATPADVVKNVQNYVYAMFGIESGPYDGSMIAKFAGGASWIILVIMSVIASVIPLLAALAVAIVMYVVAFSRSIEIGVRGMFLPIGFALMSEDGMKGAGMRYLKKFLAVCCQGIVLGIIGKLIGACCVLLYKGAFTSLSLDVTSIMTCILPLLKAEFGLAGFAVASIMMMFKSQQLITEVFGA